MPFPVIVADSGIPGTTAGSLNSTIYEFNPFELGSWDPSTYTFSPLEYIGSNFTARTIPAGQSCISGLDNAVYVMVQSTFLTLVDGGEDLQKIPLNPLIQSPREVDVIFAVDSSADTTYLWPNGTSLVATYERSLNKTIENGTAFLAIPDQNTFVNLDLNCHPTMFGRNASNTSSLALLIVYIPNGPYITLSNVSTFDDAFNNTQRNLIIENGYDAATRGNGTLDSQRPICIACVVLSRSFFKTGTGVPSARMARFARYHGNGTTNATTPSADYAPGYLLAGATVPTGSGAAVLRTGFTGALVAVVVSGILLI